MVGEQSGPRAGAAAFAVAFLLAGLFLLANLGAETKYSASGKLFAQPRFWPGVGVAGMVLFGAAHLAAVWRRGWGGSRAELIIWLRAVEFFVWFMAYVFLVPLSGYLAATVCFTLLLALREGYRGAGPLAAAALLGASIVVVFKAGLSVMIPGGAVYEYLPGAFRNFMILNF